MAITEKTKQIVAQQRNQLKQIIDANLADIEAHKDAIDAIKARNIALKEDFEALKKDIPEPTPEV